MMRKLLLTSAVLGSLGAATLPANAFPGAQPLPLASDTPTVELVRDGCGLYRHRGFYGHCRLNGGFYRGWGWRGGWHRPWGWHGGWHHRWHRW